MNDRASIFSPQFIAEAFEYRAGVVYWKERPVHHFVDQWRQRIFNSRQAGKEAGTLQNGYVMIRFDFGRVGAHQIIFVMHHGYLPDEVDHIDGNPGNNKIENLRAATHLTNSRNRKTYTTNTSGVKGVSWHKNNKKWNAGIRADGKWKHLGSFGAIEDAINARKAAEQLYYGEFANGR